MTTDRVLPITFDFSMDPEPPLVSPGGVAVVRALLGRGFTHAIFVGLPVVIDWVDRGTVRCHLPVEDDIEFLMNYQVELEESFSSVNPAPNYLALCGATLEFTTTWQGDSVSMGVVARPGYSRGVETGSLRVGRSAFIRGWRRAVRGIIEAAHIR